MTGFDLIDVVRSIRFWLAVQFRRLAYEIAVALFDRIAKGSALDDRQRGLLLEEFEEGLDDQIDDVRSGRGADLDERGAREMVVTGALIRWLQQGDDPGPEAIPFLERCLAELVGGSSPGELTLQAAFLAAIADLRDGDVSPPRAPVPPPMGYPEQRRRLLDYQGRKVRELMDGRRLGIAELSDLSRVDLVTLVGILFGLKEMRLGEWTLLSDALEVDLGAVWEGSRSSLPRGPATEAPISSRKTSDARQVSCAITRKGGDGHVRGKNQTLHRRRLLGERARARRDLRPARR
jgi:hypothetical protein